MSQGNCKATIGDYLWALFVGGLPAVIIWAIVYRLAAALPPLPSPSGTV
jgi:hypothetical protein